jgi:hypothetical protein
MNTILGFPKPQVAGPIPAEGATCLADVCLE